MVRLFLATANVGSVFDNLAKRLPLWLNEFISVIQAKDPEFVAVHFQETGGKSTESDNDNGSINSFFRQLVDRMAELHFRRAEAFVDSRSDLEDQFTALANVYFVHEELHQVQIWDFQDAHFVGLSPEVQLHIGSGLEVTRKKQKEKFPQQFFPNCKWSRKGFLRTRWRIHGVVLDFVNIHLFHDSCNITAASAFPSPFARNRERTLNYTLNKLQNDTLDKCPMFVFGDFNFRLNTYEVMNFLRHELGPHNGATDAEEVILDTKRFECPDHEHRFKTDFPWLKRYDFEAAQLSDKLMEEELTFHPTYPFEEDETLPEHFLKTRCPAWCDRVLFTPTTKDIISKESSSEYNLVGSKVCMGDHKPVYLSFTMSINRGPDVVPPTTLREMLLPSSVDAEDDDDTELQPILV